MIVCDTGPLVAAADRDDQDNRVCTDLLTGLHLARRAILVPAPVVAEVGCLLARSGGADVEAAFLRSIVAQTITIATRVLGTANEPPPRRITAARDQAPANG